MNRIQASFQNGLMEIGQFETVGLEAFREANRDVDSFLQGFAASMESIDEMKDKAKDFAEKAVEVIKKVGKAVIDFIKMVGKKIADFIRDKNRILAKKIDEFKRRGKPGDAFKTDATARIDAEGLSSDINGNIAAGRTLFVDGSSVTGYAFAVNQFAGKAGVDYLFTSQAQYSWIKELPVGGTVEKLTNAIGQGLGKLGFFGLSDKTKFYELLAGIQTREGFLKAYNESHSKVFFEITTLKDIKNQDVIDATNKTVMRSAESINAYEKVSDMLEKHVIALQTARAVEEVVLQGTPMSDTAQAHWRQKSEEAIQEIREKLSLLRYLSSIVSKYEYHRAAVMAAQMAAYGQLMDRSYSADMYRS